MKKSGISLRRCEIVSNLFDKEGNQLFDLENMKKKRNRIQIMLQGN